MSEPFPDPLEFSFYGGNWSTYEDVLYSLFCNEVVDGNHFFRGLPIRCQFRPSLDGKAFGFWHLITVGDVEEQRIPDMRRCEKLSLLGWVLRNAEKDERVLWWKNQRRRKVRVLLWIPDAEYVVILEERPSFYLLKTAYTPEVHRVASFEREWRSYWQNPW